MHTADVVFLIEEMCLGSKEMAELWGGKYRDKIDVITAIKCDLSPTFPHPSGSHREGTGALEVHIKQPDDRAGPTLP